MSIGETDMRTFLSEMILDNVAKGDRAIVRDHTENVSLTQKDPLALFFQQKGPPSFSGKVPHSQISPLRRDGNF